MRTTKNPVAPADVHKTAVTTPFGLFEFVRMPFSLRNATQMFQHFMEQVLRGIFSYAYIDDYSSPVPLLKNTSGIYELYSNASPNMGLSSTPTKVSLVSVSWTFLAITSTVMALPLSRIRSKPFEIFHSQTPSTS